MQLKVILLFCLLGDVYGNQSVESIVKASNKFANKLYQQVAKSPGNVLVCPLSLHVVLSLLHQGADGASAKQLESALALRGTNQEIRQSYQTVLTNLQDQVLSIATKLYPASHAQLLDKFVSDAKEFFLSGVERVDFSKAEEAAKTINEFVEAKTNNKIHNIIKPDDLSGDTSLVIINAVHFQSNWKTKSSQLAESTFHKEDATEVKTTMMMMESRFHYKYDRNLRARILKLDYEGNGYSMIFVLPDKVDGLSQIEAKLVNADVTCLQSGMKQVAVSVSIPRFKLELTIDLKKILQQLGVKDIFSNTKANLKYIDGSTNLHVTKVVQKTFINVNENGTEAAAATGAVVERKSKGPRIRTFIADHPFIFYLVHEKEGLILFSGRLNNPELMN